ncbi:chemotaxis protein CheD [Endozoicomonas sp. SM1973]|uniref:Probable chemoreceptor glutamine deamidase CheD n=1 Tax=Spartinivicinus marinus TaxID=2994442 RepID=A0A853I8V3_9GAMM|nr:chemotaxis protein CheD [Spartinivicinus marinus]MCX4025266.1 chemotaxis protein CheD [Spartinivicinus marinus]NYZ65987.1 chemotaxis protein CheD [Spartinivicinus marinus]
MVVERSTPNSLKKMDCQEAAEVKVVKLLPGEVYSSSEHEDIVTILGSCVATCLWDPIAKVGGMNHFMLPEAKKQIKLSSISVNQSSVRMLMGRYGNFAMFYLIESLLKKGAHLHNLQAKLFGGAKMIKHMSDIGKINAEFAISYLKEAEIPIIASHLFGNNARKIVFESRTGVVKIRELSSVYQV